MRPEWASFQLKEELRGTFTCQLAGQIDMDNRCQEMRQNSLISRTSSLIFLLHHLLLDLLLLSHTSTSRAISISLSLSLLVAMIDSSCRGPKTINKHALFDQFLQQQTGIIDYLRLSVPTVLINGILTFLQVKKL